jgi:predicted dehydrogenase
MVAYRLHFEEATLTALKRVREGEIGIPRVFTSVFGHVIREGDIRGDATLAGGALLDLGIYCINAARSLFGREPDRAFAVAAQKRGADETTSATLRFGSDGFAQFTVSNAISQVSSYRICGTEGELRVEPGFEYATEIIHHLSVAGGTRRELFARCDQFAAELHYFSRCILEGTDPEPSLEEARLDARVTDALFKSMSTGKEVELPDATRERRPSFSQVYRIPPGGEPSPLNAPPPVVR